MKKKEFPFPLCHCFFQTLRELMERRGDESFIHISFPPLSFIASCVGDREEWSEGWEECEGELKMTDNRVELKELQRGCGCGR